MRCRNGRRAVDASLYTTHAFPMIVTGFMVVECQQNSSACTTLYYSHSQATTWQSPACDAIHRGGESRKTDRWTADMAQGVESDYGKIPELLTKKS